MSSDPQSFSIPGFKLGHWTHPDGTTGCTVLLADELVPAAVEVRGGAPGTRETALLGPGKTVRAADAIILTGGSAFGLGAADGVMQWLSEQGRGFPTAVMNVPIVPGAVIFDLAGDEPVWPLPKHGYTATDNASREFIGGGLGGGAGASVSKVLGRHLATPTGVGIASVKSPAGAVSAIFVNNAFGDVYDDRRGIFLTQPDGGSSTECILLSESREIEPGQNTVIGTIVVDRRLDHDALARICISGHAGIARTIRPAHTPADGDTVFALAQGQGNCTTAELMQLSAAAQLATSRALINSLGDLQK
ncbi:MAG: P1 family peptidase [Thermomicrobiaceae bacterium]